MDILIEQLEKALEKLKQSDSRVEYAPHIRSKFNVVVDIVKQMKDLEKFDTKKRLIQEFIVESNKYGYWIVAQEDSELTGIYNCKSVCNRCGKSNIQEIGITVVKVDGEDKVKSRLSMYCDKCRDNIKNKNRETVV